MAIISNLNFIFDDNVLNLEHSKFIFKFQLKNFAILVKRFNQTLLFFIKFVVTVQGSTILLISVNFGLLMNFSNCFVQKIIQTRNI